MFHDFIIPPKGHFQDVFAFHFAQNIPKFGLIYLVSLTTWQHPEFEIKIFQVQQCLAAQHELIMIHRLEVDC